jgi:hypothetical protein
MVRKLMVMMLKTMVKLMMKMVAVRKLVIMMKNKERKK